ncbi:lysozyme inhibitor LprI family protein [Paraburkholderia sp. C35]|uniref:lysozyme inhibitor LprI family protein n=1 Tax=Paraburkholderia sp. C35 TaxID=2126993 RepID=UPI0013A59204|nr:lysozyme inhibitor LprI family protein [Paraburkholderia sp. C35]
MKFLRFFFSISLLLLSTSTIAKVCQQSNLADRTICDTESLQKADGTITHKVDVLLAAYSDSQRHSLVLGQLNWLTYRNEACMNDGVPTNELVDCLTSVYRERDLELSEEAVVQRKVQDDKHLTNAPDIEAILDRPGILEQRDNTFYYAMFFAPAQHDVDYNVFRHPSTCRELYTLDAGAWHYSGDTIGMNAQSADFQRCQFEIFEAQGNVKATYSPPKTHDFGDIAAYSTEFICLAVSCDDNHYDKLRAIESFQHKAKSGEIRIEQGVVPVWSDNACLRILVVGNESFCFEGFNFAFSLSQVSDYTGQGRQEALMDMSYFPSQGSMRGHAMLVVWYDPSAHAIRPEKIDFSSRIILKLEPDTYATGPTEVKSHKRHKRSDQHNTQ